MSLQTVLPVASPISAAASLLAGLHTPVDATNAPFTVTLPTPPRVGARLRVEKIDPTTNLVTISGTIRGVTGSSITLVWQYESIELFAETATSWRVASSHKTKAAMDAAYMASGYQPSSTSLSDASAVGRSLITAADASTARTALGVTAITVDGVAAPSLPISSTDQRGIANGIATLGADSKLTPAQAPAPDTYLGYAATVLYPQSVSGGLTAGRQWFVRVGRGGKLAASKIGFYLGATSSGSIMAGVYRPTGSGLLVAPGTLAASSGAPQTLTSLGATAVGWYQINLGAACDVAEGDYISLWGSDGTMGFGFSGMATAIPGRTDQCAYSDALGTAGTAMVSNPTGLNGHSRMLYLVAS